MIKAEGTFIQPELGFEFCELVSEAIFKGLTDYFEER
jgi:hypothetical protein